MRERYARIPMILGSSFTLSFLSVSPTAFWALVSYYASMRLGWELPERKGSRQFSRIKTRFAISTVHKETPDRYSRAPGSIIISFSHSIHQD